MQYHIVSKYDNDLRTFTLHELVRSAIVEVIHLDRLELHTKIQLFDRLLLNIDLNDFSVCERHNLLPHLRSMLTKINGDQFRSDSGAATLKLHMDMRSDCIDQAIQAINNNEVFNSRTYMLERLLDDLYKRLDILCAHDCISSEHNMKSVSNLNQLLSILTNARGVLPEQIQLFDMHVGRIQSAITAINTGQPYSFFSHTRATSDPHDLDGDNEPERENNLDM